MNQIYSLFFTSGLHFEYELFPSDFQSVFYYIFFPKCVVFLNFYQLCNIISGVDISDQDFDESPLRSGSNFRPIAHTSPTKGRHGETPTKPAVGRPLIPNR